MLQEIDQRSKTQLLIPCHCGDTHHIEFDYSLDEGWKDYYISFVEPFGLGLWDRIVAAFKYVFKKRMIFHSSEGLTSEDLKKVIEHMHKYIDADTVVNSSQEKKD